LLLEQKEFGLKLWVDDLRPAPAGWELAKNVQEAKAALLGGEVKEASLDHDLGEGHGKEGYDLVLWMAEHSVWPEKGLSVHSANPPGAEKMCALVERYGPYRRVEGTRRFVARVD
jgi:hypothetical protein